MQRNLEKIQSDFNGPTVQTFSISGDNKIIKMTKVFMERVQKQFPGVAAIVVPVIPGEPENSLRTVILFWDEPKSSGGSLSECIMWIKNNSVKQDETIRVLNCGLMRASGKRRSTAEFETFFRSFF